jgi:hypothetical protein
MKKRKSRIKDALAILVYFMAFIISLNVYDSLLFQILGIAFFIAMAYGIICLEKRAKFIF